MNNNRSYRNGTSGHSGSTGNARNTRTQYRQNTDYTRDYPQDNGYGRSYPQDGGYGRSYSQDGGYGRSYPQDDGYGRSYSQDDGYGRSYSQDDGYGRSYPERTRGSGNSRRSSYVPPDDEQPEGNDSNLPLYLLAGLAVVILIVILITVSTALLGKGSKNKADTPAGVSHSDNGQATIIGFDDTDDEDEESDETSSAVNYKNFTGTWQKTDVYESRKATVTVNAQYDDSFDFTLEMWSGTTSATITGTAFFTDESTAVFKKSAASITLEQGSQYLSIYHSGKNKAFGIADSYEIDGKYTQGTPKYVKEEGTGGYDYNIYQSDAVIKALSFTLSAEDYALYKEMMAKGLKSPIPYERTLDKNGKKVNVDAEMNAVKYYAHLSGIAADMIFICSNDAKIYVLFYDTQEMRYYTNDKNYASQMPASFRAVEKANNQKAVFK